MDSFKEFQGKSLDEAISEACGYFDAPREKLEIEILQDSKSGIFGLVGARKAMVRARRVQLRTAVEDIWGRKSGLMPQTDDEMGTEALAVKGSSDKRHNGEGHENKGKYAERPTECHDKRGKSGGAEREVKAEKEDSHDKACACPEKSGRGHDTLEDRHAGKGRGDRDHKERDQRGQDGQGCGAVSPAGFVAHGTADTFASEKIEKGECSARMEKADRMERTERAERPGSTDRTERPDKAERQDRRERPERSERPDRPERQDRRAKPAPKPGGRRGERQGEGRPRSTPLSPQRHDDGSFHGDAFGEEVLHEDGDNLQRIPFEDLDQDKLRSLSLEVVATLVAPIVGELPLTVELQDGRVNVRMDCGDDSGLLIGREGQTLASLQYLASRMVSRGMSAAVRVQLDAGEYRLRQDEKLREMALSLAEKVRATGKSHSTRPLSSYHRRIVHLVLQDSTDVQTRSSGDGPLKRVIVQRKRS